MNGTAAQLIFPLSCYTFHYGPESRDLFTSSDWPIFDPLCLRAADWLNGSFPLSLLKDTDAGKLAAHVRM